MAVPFQNAGATPPPDCACLFDIEPGLHRTSHRGTFPAFATLDGDWSLTVQGGQCPSRWGPDWRMPSWCGAGAVAGRDFGQDDRLTKQRVRLLELAAHERIVRRSAEEVVSSADGRRSSDRVDLARWSIKLMP